MAKLVATQLVGSFIGDAREGDLYDADQGRRASAWAHWALTNLTEFRGGSERTYIGLQLPGKFYDPRGTGPVTPPHIELPTWALERRDPDFALRLGQLGNTALFNWWLVPEVTAIRRVLFSTIGVGITPLVNQLSAHRGGLVEALSTLNETVGSQWSVIEGLQVAHPEHLTAAITDPFLSSEVAKLFPTAASQGLEVHFDGKLAESAGTWCSRRVGAWRLTLPGDSGSLGVATPRLTSNSLFSDPLFDPMRESVAALLVRTLLLRRLTWRFLEGSVPGVLRPDQLQSNYHLRAIVARFGAKLPEASVESAVNFVQQHPDRNAAWSALEGWSANGHVLTVSKADFDSAFNRLALCVRKAESPDRADINQVLPLAWDSKNRVVRVTFSRQREEGATK